MSLSVSWQLCADQKKRAMPPVVATSIAQAILKKCSPLLNLAGKRVLSLALRSMITQKTVVNAGLFVVTNHDCIEYGIECCWHIYEHPFEGIFQCCVQKLVRDTCYSRVERALRAADRFLCPPQSCAYAVVHDILIKLLAYALCHAGAHYGMELLSDWLEGPEFPEGNKFVDAL